MDHFFPSAVGDDNVINVRYKIRRHAQIRLALQKLQRPTNTKHAENLPYVARACRVICVGWIFASPPIAKLNDFWFASRAGGRRVAQNVGGFYTFSTFIIILWAVFIAV